MYDYCILYIFLYKCEDRYDNYTQERLHNEATFLHMNTNISSIEPKPNIAMIINTHYFPNLLDFHLRTPDTLFRLLVIHLRPYFSQPQIVGWCFLALHLLRCLVSRLRHRNCTWNLLVNCSFPVIVQTMNFAYIRGRYGDRSILRDGRLQPLVPCDLRMIGMV